ncbi:PREDICTED: NLR family member X1-like [Cyprinodon variegatus]|uniref:NLR family member X1-like n=1 Tax=Cyprinodon variegatus TaxID=28743 RepID=UPI0007424FBE|nr:PREDICTED: NLR family member X1-like [Cyprinodon variegatus]
MYCLLCVLSVDNKSHSQADKETNGELEELLSKMKKRFLEEISFDKEENHPNQKTTEHIIREKSGAKEEESKQKKPVKLKEIFKEKKGKTIRTVLTIGEAGIGKSFHMQKFTKEWAENNNKTWSIFSWFTKASSAEKKVEFLFPLKFSELNFVKEKKISLIELLNHFFEETKNIIISDYSQLRIVFLLDGLDAYQHSLDFDNSEILNDVREPTSLDVLLVNLIKGNLLPEAKVWITSRPSAADKIPDDVVDRITEIRGDNTKGSDDLKKVILEELSRYKNDQKLSEIGIFDDKEKWSQVKYSKLFSENKTRTVLMKGVPGIGKTFQTRMFMIDWAERKSNKDITALVSLPFTELIAKKDEEKSMKSLFNFMSGINPNSRIPSRKVGVTQPR